YRRAHPLWRGRPTPTTLTLPRPGAKKRGKGSGGGGRGKPPSKGGQEGKEGGLEGGTGTTTSTATKYSTGKYTEEGAGDGRGGLGEPTDVGTEPTPGTETGSTAETGKGGTEAEKEGGKKGGTEGGSDEGSPDSSERKGGESTVLGTLAALASLIADPTSLHEAKQSSKSGSGSQFGSKSGFISGWLGQILVIGAVFGGPIVKAIRAIGGAAKKAFHWLFGSVERKAITKEATTALRRVGDLLESAEDVIANPQLLSGKAPAQVEAIIGKTSGWRIETLGKGSHKGQGWVFREYTPRGDPTGRSIRWHPGGGHHGGDPYWRVTGGPYGKSDIIR
ncbi:MAG: hypothetical protein ACREBC_28580, partial [Pyrinomonadaceae bacterium]